MKQAVLIECQPRVLIIACRWRSLAISIHQTFQVPKMEVLTYISCMDTAYVRKKPTAQIAGYKVQDSSILGVRNSW